MAPQVDSGVSEGTERSICVPDLLHDGGRTLAMMVAPTAREA